MIEMVNVGEVMSHLCNHGGITPHKGGMEELMKGSHPIKVKEN